MVLEDGQNPVKDKQKFVADLRKAIDAATTFCAQRSVSLGEIEDLIAAYNAGSKNIEQMFEELLALSRDLSSEQQRHVRESMSEEGFSFRTAAGTAVSRDGRR